MAELKEKKFLDNEGVKTLWENIKAIMPEEGLDGKSAYEIAKDLGFEGSEEEWIKSLQGVSGVYVGSDEMPEDYNVQVDPEGIVIDLSAMIDEKLDQRKTEADKEQDAYAGFADSIGRMSANPTEPLNIITYDGSNKPTHPKVLYCEEGWNGHKYWMTYTPFPENDNTYENPCIAYSDDGVNFISGGITNPIEDTPMENGVKIGYNSDSHLVLANNILECWWRTHYQSGSNANYEVIYRATSTNGFEWSEKEELFRVNDASAGSCLSPAVIYENNIYKIWAVYKQQFVKYYESADGTNWTEIRDIFVDNPDYPTYRIWHIDITHTNKGYEFVGCYHPIWNYDDNRYIYYATSEDNVTYTKPILVLTQGPNGNFDSTELYRPSLVRLDNRVMLYYGCRNGFGNWRIGMTEAPTPYLLNAVVQSSSRLDAIEKRLLALETSGSSLTEGVSRTFKDSAWIKGYYNDQGVIEDDETLTMYHSELIPVPTDDLIHTINNNALYLRITYFDKDKNPTTFDRGDGLGVQPWDDDVRPTIQISKTAGVYFAVSANTIVKEEVIWKTEQPKGLLAKYLGSKHGDTEGVWEPVIGNENITINGATWNNGVLVTDGVDDTLVLPLSGAKSVVFKITPLERWDVGDGVATYYFDCRPTADAYIINYKYEDYVGSAATVYANGTKFGSDTVFGDYINVWYTYEFVVQFNEPFTGNMILCSSAENPEAAHYLNAQIEYIEVYDKNVKEV